MEKSLRIPWQRDSGRNLISYEAKSKIYEKVLESNAIIS